MKYAIILIIFAIIVYILAKNLGKFTPDIDFFLDETE